MSHPKTHSCRRKKIQRDWKGKHLIIMWSDNLFYLIFICVCVLLKSILIMILLFSSYYLIIFYSHARSLINYLSILCNYYTWTSEFVSSSSFSPISSPPIFYFFRETQWNFIITLIDSSAFCPAIIIRIGLSCLESIFIFLGWTT